ncbi:chitin synthase-domain-containing protein [Mycena alexandri]|uniref:chitin synthase n=1 Tax=Mycena alexandri TaxID=1745969 RepID=A0AAD6X7T3_9AGAR|nr:chitin synthase-domain-containing protein [Mycena alexandri]
MKRPHVRLAWREKLAIFLLIFLLNARVVFYIIVFGKLLCPKFDKAWGVSKGDHSDVSSETSNGQDVLETLAGQDLTYYFPASKRDSQILLMHYLNRMHFDAPVSPLELEIYHQMRNVIGIDPAFYEYIFTIDADTNITPDSLNRLVASAADDLSIISIRGETKLQNEDESWWTMIQVYEYQLSHHLSEAFESLFGSVTCLPSCFSLYRICTADKGRPIIISNLIIDEYAQPNIDTLPDQVHDESWKVLFSQQPRWINSMVHNLCELVLLPELFGFCCFFMLYIDLLGTLSSHSYQQESQSGDYYHDTIFTGSNPNLQALASQSVLAGVALQPLRT